MDRKRELLQEIRTYTPSDRQYQVAKAELDILMTQEYLDLLQKTRENLYEVLAEMSGGIVRFRDAIDRAATQSDATSKTMVRWTRILSVATIGLVLATAALVYATLRAG
jgi:hypothetical protein